MRLFYYISGIYLFIISCIIIISQNKNGQTVTPIKIPIIYSDKYNIRLLGFQKLHPFDTEKYEKIYHYLLKHPKIDKNSFFEPDMISDEQLLNVHHKDYLQSLSKSKNIAEIAELPFLDIVPHNLLQKKLLLPMKYGAGGTILGAEITLDKGWAINLSGGYHHAKRNKGEGFCYFSDIAMAIYALWEKDSTLKVLIVDLDAHQGNGVASIFSEDKRISIFDIYNDDIYPNDIPAKKYIDFNFPVPSFTTDTLYLDIIREELPKAIDIVTPDFIFFNAGSDILQGDQLGGLHISAAGMVNRDEIVFQHALTRKIPILMVLSGGYMEHSGHIIGKSIMNLLENVIKI